MSRLIDDLNELHDQFIESVNIAIGDDDLDRAHELASKYDDEAIVMIAQHEGRTHLLPLQRPANADSGLRSMIRRLARQRAA